MDENKKEYTVVGTVTIGTDEYRELVESRIIQERRADEYRDKYWSEQAKVKSLEAQVEALKSRIAKCEKFLKNNFDASGDVISVFMSLFGEDE